MTRALFVTTVAGTHSSFLLPFALHFRGRGWRVDGAAAGIASCPGCHKAYDNVYEMEWSRNPLHPLVLYSCIRRIRSLVDSGSYDLVHVHTPIAAFLTRFALCRVNTRTKPKLVYTAHGFHFHPKGNPLTNAAFIGMEQLAGRWTDRLVVINRHDEAAAAKFGIVAKERLVYMPGIGIDRAYYSPENVKADEIARIRQEMGLGDNNSLFLVAADLIPRKRHKDVIQAFRGVKGEPHLAFAGNGKSYGKLKKLVENAGLGSRVHFLGLRTDIPALMRSSVATISASLQEGLSRSVMESLCLEVPVIGTNIRGISELIEGGGGLLVSVRSPDTICKAMNWILEHPIEARAIGQKGRETTSKYALDNVLRLHEDLYAGLLSN